MLPRNLSKLAQSCCLATAAVFAAMPATNALADDRGDRYRDAGRRSDFRGYDRHDDHRDRDDHRARPSIGISIGGHTGGPVVDCPPPARVVHERVYVEPVYRTVAERKWVEPVYRTVTDRVWVEPVVKQIPDRKWVPD